MSERADTGRGRADEGKESRRKSNERPRARAKQPCAHPALDYTSKPPRCTKCRGYVLRPNRGPQEQFLATPAFEALYGGAAGSGKSWGMLIDALRDVDKPTYRAAIFRRKGPELAQLLDDAFAIFPLWGAQQRAPSGRRFWEFPSRARIYFASMEHAQDAYDYKSYEFQRLYFDELTTFEESQYEYLMSRLRGVGGLDCYVRAGSNPDGPGREWVLRRWRWWLYRPGQREDEFDGPYADPGQVLWILRDPVSGEERPVSPSARLVCGNCRASWLAGGDSPPAAETPDGTPDPGCRHVVATTRTFVPARLHDNPPLAATDYGKILDARDPLTRLQLKEGNWMVRAQPGTVFRASWFQLCLAPPARMRSLCRYWDRAGTDSPTAAWTVGLLGGRGDDGRYYVLDVVRVRLDAANVPELVRQTAERDDLTYGRRVTQWLEQDPGSAGKYEAGSIVRLCAGHDVRALRPTGDKVTRALPVAAQAAPPASNVFLVRAPWNAALLEELELFPGGYADQVDALSGLFAVLAGDSLSASASGNRPLAQGGSGGY